MIGQRHIRPLLLGIVLLLRVGATAQTRVEVYPNDRMLWSEVLMNIERGVVREGGDWRGDVLWTVRQEQIFKGYSSSSFDLQFTVRAGHLIQGDSHFSDAIMYTIEGNTIYIGDSTFPLDLVYTLRPEPRDSQLMGLYKEDSLSSFDRICVFQGQPNHAELFALLLALGLL